MSNERDDGTQHLIHQLSGIVHGIQSVVPAQSLQQGRYLGGRGIDGKDLCDCAVNPTHCFRTVSQRSLSVPVRFLSAIAHPAQLPAAADIFEALTFGAGGIIPGVVPGQVGIEFNNANVQLERRRVYDMVLVAIRTEITVNLSDSAPIAAGAIDISSVQSRLEEMAGQYLELKCYHSADRLDPWFDRTNLGYFQRPRGEYQKVPPVMWIDRDPAMELTIGVAESGFGVNETPNLTYDTRDLNGVMSVMVESLFIPDPYSCPDDWPGSLCPRDMIGNTPDYKGKILSAVRKLTKR